jgi:hypothetical protein
MRSSKLLLGILACGSLMAATEIGVRRGQAQVEQQRSELMRRKLDYSKDVLAGLTRENFTLIADGAASLKALSDDAVWKTATIPNAEQYLAYTRDFQRLCDELSQKAKAKNIDGAALAYVQLTMNCVNCHKYVRSVTK